MWIGPLGYWTQTSSFAHQRQTPISTESLGLRQRDDNNLTLEVLDMEEKWYEIVDGTNLSNIQIYSPHIFKCNFDVIFMISWIDMKLL